MINTPVIPYGLQAPAFRFPGLAIRAARGQLGGDRELALAAFVAARLVAGALGPSALPVTERAPRAQHARTYFAALSLPSAARTAYARLADATGIADRDLSGLAAALRVAIEMTSRVLHGSSREELEALYRAVMAATG